MLFSAFLKLTPVVPGPVLRLFSRVKYIFFNIMSSTYVKNVVGVVGHFFKVRVCSRMLSTQIKLGQDLCQKTI